MDEVTMEVDEQQAFDAWRASTSHQSFMTGWIIWRASLAHHGVSVGAAVESRPLFDQWLYTQNVGRVEWTEYDAWTAAAVASQMR
jgi:hypothetical protein